MSSTEAKKDSGNQKWTSKNGILTKVAFVAVAIALVVTLAHGHF